MSDKNTDVNKFPETINYLVSLITTFMSDKNTDVNKFRETINYLVSLIKTQM